MDMYLNDEISSEDYCDFIQLPKYLNQKSTHKRRIFDIKKINHYQCEKNFRFDHEELGRILKGLALPEYISTTKRDRFSSNKIKI